MRIRPYPAWGLMACVLAISGWRVYERPGAEYAFTTERPGGFVTRMTPEELDSGLPHRYDGVAAELKGARGRLFLRAR